MYLYERISKRLIEFDFEPSERRILYIYYELEYYISISNDMIDKAIKDCYMFDRIKNNKLSRKVIDSSKVIKYTDKWIYIKRI
jgi:hypothetical protein